MLIDGGDSVGIQASVERVYLNIGTFSEEWGRLHRPIIGFRVQRPFSVATLQKNSVYWRTSEQYRAPAIVEFFKYENPQTKANVAQPMPLASALDAPVVSGEARTLAQDLARGGRRVFLENCAICHSSKQPAGFALEFSDDWEKKGESAAARGPRFVLPQAFADWERFTKSAAYAEYVRQIVSVAGTPDGGRDLFLEHNYLSTDIRVPVTLVGTNSARAVGTNAMRGQVWDNFSSEDYKNLPAVGAVHFYNPYSGAPLDEWGNNDIYYPPPGGPGYYRPPSLIGLWATAPYLHTNALGLYTGDPTVEGRLKAFDDGIDKLLWKSLRRPRANAGADKPPDGDLRLSDPELAGSDAGFIYRTTEPSRLIFKPRFIRPLIESVLGPFWTQLATWYAWIGLAVVYVALAIAARARHAALAVLLIGILASIALVVTRLDRIYGAWPWLVPISTVAAATLLWFFVRDRWRWIPRVTFIALAVASLGVGWVLEAFTSARFDIPLIVGPIPRGTPVSLIMNASPSADVGDIADAVFALLRGGSSVKQLPQNATEREKLDAFEREAGLALLRVSKCPDFVLDRGHWFAEPLSDAEKVQLRAFLKTL